MYKLLEDIYYLDYPQLVETDCLLLYCLIGFGMAGILGSLPIVLLEAFAAFTILGGLLVGWKSWSWKPFLVDVLVLRIWSVSPITPRYDDIYNYFSPPKRFC